MITTSRATLAGQRDAVLNGLAGMRTASALRIGCSPKGRSTVSMRTSCCHARAG